MKTRLRGFEFELDPRDVVDASKQLQQGWGRKYAVQVDGGYYAPKDLMWSFLQKKTAGKLLKIDFTTEDAVRTLRRLGFKVLTRTAGQGVRKAKLSSLAGALSIGGNAVRESDYYDE